MLQDSVEKLTAEIGRIDLAIVNAADVLQLLKENRNIKSEQTGMSVSELMKLVDYYKAKTAELQIEIANLQSKKIKILEQQAKLKNQISEEEKKNIKTSGRLILQLMVATAGKYDLTVSYISPNAFWTPFYDIRVDDIKNPLKVIYKA